MKLITKKTDYAIRAITSLAGKSEMASVNEMSSQLKIPKPFLRKILQVLNSEGILKSLKGKGGGFKLAVSPENIRLKDIINIFQGPVKLSDCFIQKNPCPDISSCILKSEINRINDMVDRELSSITMDSLL